MRSERNTIVDLKSYRIQGTLRDESEPSVSQNSETIANLASDLSSATARISQLQSEKDHLQSQLGVAKEYLRKRDQLLKQKDKQIEVLNQELRAKPPSSEMPQDPNGYHRILGIHPSFAQGLTPLQRRALFQGFFHVQQRLFHPDTKGNLERSKKINNAHDELAKIYGK